MDFKINEIDIVGVELKTKIDLIAAALTTVSVGLFLLSFHVLF